MSDITKADKVYVSTSKNGDYVSAINDEDSVTFIRADLVPQWQPIETAPKDGTDILVYHPERAEQFVCYFLGGLWMFSVDDALATNPTHWQPLPTPPPAT